MPFRLRIDTRKWFKNIEKEFKLDFDMWYLCFIAGLATYRKEDVLSEQTTELVDNFPGLYREKSRVIVALFLSRELKEMGIRFTERKVLHKEIRKLLDPLSPSQLSDIGQKEINRYSYGGFEEITEWFPDRPRKMETFLPMYHLYLSEHLVEKDS